MATAVASKPSAPHQTKMKRPPLPTVQTNGIQSSRSSPSPLASSKRPPSGFKAPPTPTVNGMGITSNVNGVQPRLSQRRKDSQKPGDMSRIRNGKDGERRSLKRRPEPFVKSQAYILRKYRGYQPSLIIHLHATNFRFDQQNGSFSYNSPMKFVLEHLKSQTVPHNMIEELMTSGVKFFEGCLIVQVKDHRSNPGSHSASTSDTKGSNIASSIHNYEQWVTPSSYVAYPELKKSDVEDKDATNTDAQNLATTKEKDKAKEPKTTTIVLFPTPLSIQEEAHIQANTPDSRPGNRRNQGANAPRTPASASGTVPPTPISAIPTMLSTSGPPAKRQKMSITGEEIQGFESKIIAATAPPLFLDPVADLEEAYTVLDSLTDPLHRMKHPSPKTRKRTVAELAADERIAAQEQSFMLIMDEKAGSNPTTGKVSAKDDAGTVPFEPRFERFNTIQHIKTLHEEQARVQDQQKKRNEAEAKRHEQVMKANRAQKEHQERLERENKAQMVAQQQASARMSQQQRDRANQMRQHQLANQNGIAHGQSNGVMTNGYSQPQHSSPVIRNGTPHSNASPVVGNMMVSQAGGVPMQATSSGQGSSPGRPPSSMQHGHPAAGGIAMVHQRSRQQNPSRTSTPQMNGTPHMPNATPNIPHSTPVIGQGTPTTRMPHGSPQNGVHTPAMNHNMMANQQVQHQMSPEQYQAQMRATHQRQQFLAQQHQQAQHTQQALLQQRQMQQQNAHMAPNGPGQVINLRELAAQQQQQQQREAAIRQQHALMNGMNGHPHMPNGASPQVSQQQQQNPVAHHQGQPQSQPGQQRPMGQVPQPSQQSAMPNAIQQRQAQILNQEFNRIGQSMAQAAGLMHPNQLSPQQKNEARARAQQRTQEIINQMKMEAQRQQQQQRQQAQIQQQQMRIIESQRQQQAHGAGSPPSGMAVSAMGMGGVMSGGQSMGGGGQGLTREQQQQLIMAQMGHLGQGGNGMGMNGMNGMNGMG